MPSNALALDLVSFLRDLSFDADQLVDAKSVARTSRTARSHALDAARAPIEGSRGEGGGGEPAEQRALRKALAFYLLSRPEESDAALQRAGDSPQAALLRGRVALERGDPGSALNAFSSLVGSPVDGRTLLIDLATAAGLSGDSPMAQKAAQKLPDGPDALYAEGISFEADGEYEDAKKKYEAALRDDPNHARSLFRLALRLDTEGQDARAIDLYRRLVGLAPTFVNGLLNLALLYEDRGRFAEAEQCYRRVLEADPHHARARVGLRDVVASQSMYFDEDHERREDRRAQVLRTPISEFELSVRSRNCLSKMNIDTLGDLVRKSEAELLAYKNFGETSLQEIKDILAQKGLRLGMTLEDDAPLQTATRAEAEAQLDALFGSLPARSPVAPPPPSDYAAAGGRDPATIPIEEMDLSIRARRCMENLEITTVADLLDRTESELLGAKNFGQTSLNEIRRKLESMGYALRKK
jgi:DNA-directed RNA polymerase subunit alpha